MKSYKHLFSRALAAAPEKLHFAAHSHHLWPDASYAGHARAWEDAATHADRKWEIVFGEVIPEVQRHIARELRLPDPATIALAPNSHELVVRLFSAKWSSRPLNVLTSDGEFHSFRRQLLRWQEAGMVHVDVVPCAPFETFTQRYLTALTQHTPDIAFVSHVMFKSGLRFDGIELLAAHAAPYGPWVVVDGYHAFMAQPVDLSGVADRVFYLAGGYKYAMAGEGAAFLHAPPHFGPRPVDTGWFAEMADLEGGSGDVRYAGDGSRFWGATFDPAGLYRFNAVCDMLDGEGLDTRRIHERVSSLRARVAAEIRTGRAGVLGEAEILTPNADGAPARFLALRERRAAQWKSALQDQGVIVDARDDVLRIGFGLYHDEQDIVVLCERARRL